MEIQLLQILLLDNLPWKMRT